MENASGMPLTYVTSPLPKTVRYERLSRSRCIWCDNDYNETDEVVKFQCKHYCHKRCADKFSLKTDDICFECSAPVNNDAPKYVKN